MADTKRRINHGSEAAIRLRSPVISLYRAGTSDHPLTRQHSAFAMLVDASGAHRVWHDGRTPRSR